MYQPLCGTRSTAASISSCSAQFGLSKSLNSVIVSYKRQLYRDLPPPRQAFVERRPLTEEIGVSEIHLRLWCVPVTTSVLPDELKLARSPARPLILSKP